MLWWLSASTCAGRQIPTLFIVIRQVGDATAQGVAPHPASIVGFQTCASTIRFRMLIGALKSWLQSAQTPTAGVVRSHLTTRRQRWSMGRFSP